MATIIDSSDEEIITPRQRRLSAKSNKLTDSDDSDNNSNSSNEQTTQSHGKRSDRIRRRQSREFRLPDKRAYRDSITTTDVILKPLSPKKLVNNFTKVNNSYNAETYDTDEDDLSDFIVYDDEVDVEDESDEESDIEMKKSLGRVDRNKTECSASKRHRVREISSSDSESEMKSDDSKSNTTVDDQLIIPACINENSTIDVESNKNEISSFHPTKRKSSSSDKEIYESKQAHSIQELESISKHTDSGNSSESSDSQLATSSSKKKRQLVSSSDSESEGSHDPCIRSATSRSEQRQKHRQELFRELKEARRQSK